MLSVQPSSLSPATFSVSINSSVPAGSYLPLNYTWTAGEYTVNRDVIIHVGAIIEDVETGDFLNYAWQNEDLFPWTIDNETLFQGASSFRSGLIPHSATTELKINYSVAQDDTIRFYRKVSSEEGYDFLKFYIDGIEIQAWSGLVDWSEVKFPVAIGDHLFSWVYEKDDIIASNQDASWIDYIEFPAGNAVSPNSINNLTTDRITSYAISPNPTSDGSFILFGNGLQNGLYDVKLFDATGRLVQQKSIANYLGNNQWNCSIDNSNSGIYFIEITQPDSFKQTLKLIVR
jgi:hypothetical protein